MSKIPLLIIVVAVLLGVAALAVPLAGASGTSSGPEQPVAFTHLTHAGNLGIQCEFCHRNVDKGANASVPAVGQCMFCHKVVNNDNTQLMQESGGSARAQEIQKVRDAFTSNTPINWVRVHRVPDHVRFVHEAHIKAGFQCSTCHGDIQSMERVHQVRALNMGDCLGCHRENNAPTDCSICHK